MTQSLHAEQKPVVITPSPVKVIDYKTDLGLTGWHVETHDIPVLTISICFRNAGDKNDPEGLAGLTEFMCGMLDEGAGSYNSGNFKALLLEKNIRLSISQNSDSVFITLRSTKDNIKDLFDILTMILIAPRFDADAMARVREQILTGLNQSLHSEGQVVSDTFNQQAFKSHPYGRSTNLEIEGVKKIKKEDIQKHLKERLARDQIKITSAGDISINDLKKHLDTALKDLPANAVPNTIKDIQPIYTGDITVVHMDIPQSVILFYQPGIKRQDKDFYAAYVLNKILGDGGFKSRLWDEVRENRGLAYGIDSDLRWVQHTDYTVGSTATANANAGQVVEIIREQWHKVKEKGVSQKEMDFVIERLTGAFPLGFSSTPQIVGLLNNYQQDDLGADFINKRNEMIRSVTLEDINRLAKNLIQPDKLSFIIVGKPEGLPQSKGAKK
ncbi:M16 family metallopeptidase [Candidatus Odyssella acanthamoebae]|uniref:M16 family metallopeptidase n=1 Tax=Candidatus Odyssella acanthamoebae TaxID=91604 RepID=UPI00068A1F23|nr:pitrilysin family protein [Candidatus Paracaedibacter acanthamoebae]